MALTVQNVVDAVSTDVRQVIGNTSTDAAVMIDWVNRVHKDCLHTSIYAYLNQSSQTVAATAGVYTYTLSGTPRRVLSVFDRTFQRMLLPLEAGAAPVPLATHIAPPGGTPSDGPLGTKVTVSAKTMGPWPEYYRFLGTNTLSIFPAPSTSTWACTLEVQTEGQVADLTSLSDNLTIPTDGKDMVVAGVNSIAFDYLQNQERTAFWLQAYEKMKAGVPVL